MKRDQFEHTIRAAGAVLGVHELLVIRSQALHARVEHELPAQALRSVEAATRGVIAWCLEIHDHWISKAIAGREKDLEFCRALLASSMVQRSELGNRLMAVDGLGARVRTVVDARISA